MLEVIHRYKYQRHLWFEPFLADLLLREALPVLRGEKWDWIVPVPLHGLKHREREFNQAERLAACLSRGTGICLNTNILRRISPTLTQTKLTRQQRAANMTGAFAVSKSEDIQDQRFVIVDDVFTTGATTNACAQALRRAGAADICVWTVARGL